MNVLKIILMSHVFLAVVAVGTSCNKPKKSSASPSPTVDAQRLECEARGIYYRWENNQCISLKTDEQLCLERTGYIWQDGVCLQTPEQQCISGGGQWVNGACVGGNGMNQLGTCQNLGTYQGALACVQTRTSELEAYLRSLGSFSWYNDVERDLNSIKSKNADMTQNQIQSLSELGWFAKQKICLDLRSINTQRSHIETKLRFTADNALERAKPYINNLNTAVEHTRELVSCGIL